MLVSVLLLTPLRGTERTRGTGGPTTGSTGTCFPGQQLAGRERQLCTLILPAPWLFIVQARLIKSLSFSRKHLLFLVFNLFFHLVGRIFPHVSTGAVSFITSEKSVTSVMSDFLRPNRLQSIRLLCPWDFPGKNTRVGCHFLLQGIFPTQGWTLHCSLFTAEPLGKPLW